MKKILSLLLCYVFLQAETFALRGGPGGAGSRRLVGSYSGTLTQTGGGASLGLFLLTAQNSGASNGSIVFFAPSTTTRTPGPIGFGTTGGSGYHFYSGTITGIVSPSSGVYTGLFNSTSQVSTSTGAVAVVTTLTLSGSIQLQASAVATSSNSQQVTGTAAAAASTGTVSSYTVTGWQTSADAVANGFAQASTGP